MYNPEYSKFGPPMSRRDSNKEIETRDFVTGEYG